MSRVALDLLSYSSPLKIALLKRKNRQQRRTRPGAIIAQENHPAGSSLSTTPWTLAGINSPPGRVGLLSNSLVSPRLLNATRSGDIFAQ